MNSEYIEHPSIVMAGFGPAIHVLGRGKDVDARDTKSLRMTVINAVRYPVTERIVQKSLASRGLIRYS